MCVFLSASATWLIRIELICNMTPCMYTSMCMSVSVSVSVSMSVPMSVFVYVCLCLRLRHD